MSKKRQQQKPRQLTRPAFTLIEILVVVSILVILTSLLVPRLRTVTKERNIREAARVVGSMFARASSRAVTDGVCGVLLQRNDNFALANGYEYAATRMALLRRVPNFTGDVVGAMVTPTPGTPSPADPDGQVTIAMPLEQMELEIVQAGDSILFGTSSLFYQIVRVVPDGANLILWLDGADELTGVWDSYLPDPSKFTGTPEYSIRRLPRLLKSSVVDLPAGHIIDLRFSGCRTTDSGFEVVSNNLRGGTGVQLVTDVVEPDPRKIELDAVSNPISFSNSDIALLFDDQGKFDQIIFRASYVTTRPGNPTATSAFIRTPQSPFFAFVARSETDITINPIADENSLWVSAGNTSGIVNVGYNNPSGKQGFSPQNTSLDFLESLYASDDVVDRGTFNNEISAARAIAVTGSAAQ